MLVLVGLLAGFIAGLLGLGGGIVIVPLLTLAFTWLGVPAEHVYRLAVGTSMATIIVTSLTSARTHHSKAPLAFHFIRPLAPSLVVGTLAGSWAATMIPVAALKVVFLLFLLAMAFRMFFAKEVPAQGEAQKPLPLLLACGLVIGFFCSLVGIAGGAIIVPFLIWAGLSMHCSIGTSAALGFFIALSGAAGYAFNGLGVPGLPWGALGYVHLPALGAVILGTVLSAPRGARLAHKLSSKQLRAIFAATMLVMCLTMAWGLVRQLML